MAVAKAEGIIINGGIWIKFRGFF